MRGSDPTATTASLVTARRITVGLIGGSPADPALRFTLDEAERHGAVVTVVATGPASPAEDQDLQHLVRLWAAKHPAVPVTLAVRRGVDAVVTLAAASRQADLLVVQGGTDPRSAAVVEALARLVHCDLLVVGGSSGAGRHDEHRAGGAFDEMAAHRGERGSPRPVPRVGADHDQSRAA